MKYSGFKYRADNGFIFKPIELDNIPFINHIAVQNNKPAKYIGSPGRLGQGKKYTYKPNNPPSLQQAIETRYLYYSYQCDDRDKNSRKQGQHPRVVGVGYLHLTGHFSRFTVTLTNYISGDMKYQITQVKNDNN